jgi:hypothetical protein
MHVKCLHKFEHRSLDVNPPPSSDDYYISVILCPGSPGPNYIFIYYFYVLHKCSCAVFIFLFITTALTVWPCFCFQARCLFSSVQSSYSASFYTFVPQSISIFFIHLNRCLPLFYFSLLSFHLASLQHAKAIPMHVLLNSYRYSVWRFKCIINSLLQFLFSSNYLYLSVRLFLSIFSFPHIVKAFPILFVRFHVSVPYTTIGLTVLLGLRSHQLQGLHL